MLSANEDIGQISLRLSGSSLMMNLFDNNDADITKDYLPNNPISISFGLFYKGFGGYFGKGISIGDLVEDIETTYTDVQIFYYFSTIGFDVFYQDYKGYYHKSDIYSNIQRFDNLILRTYGVNFYYKVLGSCDLSKLNYIAIDEVSKLSWVMYIVASLSERQMNSEIPILTSYDVSTFSRFENVNKLDFIIPSLSLGLFVPFHTLNFSINPGLSLGVGYPISNYDPNPLLTVKGSIKMNMQYIHKSFVVGSTANGDFDSIIYDNSQGFQFISIKVNLYFGYKIKKS